MTNHAHQTALVTGASSGIGRAIARQLADDGYRVAVCARRQERLDTLVAEIADDGGQALAVPCDLRDESQILGMFDRIRDAWGGVDVLVNNAGLGRSSPLTSGQTDDWRMMLEVNVLGLLICTREAVSDMKRRGDAGHVIHVSSMSGHRLPDSSTGAGAVYAATKHAVKVLTEGLRRELRGQGSGIRVGAISPGFVETEFAQKYNRDPAAAEATYGQYDVLSPDDVARMVRFILAQPPHVQVHDLLVRPTQQES